MMAIYVRKALCQLAGGLVENLYDLALERHPIDRSSPGRRIIVIGESLGSIAYALYVLYKADFEL